MTLRLFCTFRLGKKLKILWFSPNIGTKNQKNGDKKKAPKRFLCVSKKF